MLTGTTAVTLGVRLGSDESGTMDLSNPDPPQQPSSQNVSSKGPASIAGDVGLTAALACAGEASSRLAVQSDDPTGDPSTSGNQPLCRGEPWMQALAKANAATSVAYPV